MGHEKRMLSRIGADVDKYALIGECRLHDISYEEQKWLFIGTHIENVPVNIIAGIAFVTHSEKIGSEIKVAASKTRGNVRPLIEAPKYPIKLVTMGEIIVRRANSRGQADP